MKTDRYTRFLHLAGVGDKALPRLMKSRVTLVGCGTLGGAYAENLIRTGIGSLTLIDRDIVEEHNLGTQVLYTEADLAQPTAKATAARQRLASINSSIDITAQVADLTFANAEDLLCGSDLIIDATDNFDTRFLINDVAVKHALPWIYTGVVGYRGVCLAVVPGQTPCLRCLMDELPAPGQLPTCETEGVLLAAAQAIAAIGFSEALQILLQRVPRYGLSEWDMDSGSWRRLQPVKRPDCPVCAQGRYDYLAGKQGSKAAKLCGRDLVHIKPDVIQSLDLPALAAVLEREHPVQVTDDLLHVRLPEAEVYLFRDGRAFIKGIADLTRARTIFNRYISG